MSETLNTMLEEGTDDSDKDNNDDGGGKPSAVVRVTIPILPGDGKKGESSQVVPAIMHTKPVPSRSADLYDRIPEGDEPNLKLVIPMTMLMPHIAMPIGKDGSVSMKGMLDSGAGLSTGELEYHIQIAKMFPHIVAKFAFVKDVAELKEFKLGGIGDLPTGTTVVAAIMYHLPFKCNG